MNIIPHEWSVNDDDYDRAGVINLYGEKAIFSVHGLLRLRGLSEEAKRRFQYHCQDLRKM